MFFSDFREISHQTAGQCGFLFSKFRRKSSLSALKKSITQVFWIVLLTDHCPAVFLCFTFCNIPFQGLDKLLPYDISGLKSMLNIIDTSNGTYSRHSSAPSQLESVMKFKTTTDAFLWPRDNSSAIPPRVKLLLSG